MAKNAKYKGSRTIDGLAVSHGGKPLEDYRHIKEFCRAGFEWGYDGDAPRQLAFAILMHHTNDADVALGLERKFASGVVAMLDNHWEITAAEIDGFIKENNP